MLEKEQFQSQLDSIREAWHSLTEEKDRQEKEK